MEPDLSRNKAVLIASAQNFFSKLQVLNIALVLSSRVRSSALATPFFEECIFVVNCLLMPSVCKSYRTHCRIFSSIISPQTLDLLPRFKFNPRFEHFEDSENICLPLDWIHPTSPRVIINEGHKIICSSY
ncbi:hypothetical protein Sjap_017992 [Stephania japonica]|uniref:Uncharacterized protein n=1 Tax=Stephania japonica TaxID=461633 RepID=A0AAP0I785_9MAGN